MCHASRIVPTTVACLCFVLLHSSLPAGGATPPRLCIEYLPGIIYEDQPLAVCVRVEAGGAGKMPVRLTVSLRDTAGRVLASDVAEGAAEANAPWRHHSVLVAARKAPAALAVTLTGTKGDDKIGEVTVGVLGAREPLPPLRVKGMRLVDEAGRRVVLRIEHRVRKPDETWPLLRWLHHRLYGDRWAFRRVLVLGDDLGAPRDGYLSQIARPGAPFAASALAVASDARQPAPPILRAVAALASATLGPTPDLAVLCLGHRDADYGTDVLEFGRALELIMQQLELRGCHRFAVAAPTGPSHLRARLAPYVAAARHTARTYRARSLDLDRRMSDKHWAGEGKDARLVLRQPNAKGHRALADAIVRHLRRLHR